MGAGQVEAMMEVSQLLGSTDPAPASRPGEEEVPAVFLSAPKVDSPVPLKLEPPEPCPTPQYVMNRCTVVHGVLKNINCRPGQEVKQESGRPALTMSQEERLQRSSENLERQCRSELICTVSYNYCLSAGFVKRQWCSTG